MHFVVVGLNFKTADVRIREKFHFPAERLPEAYAVLNSYSSVNGSMILSTCNRVEIYASVSDVDDGFFEILQFISKFHKIHTEDITPFVYQKNCHEAVFHLLRVISSLDSMVIGEYQIQGQVRDAYFRAQELKATNNMINKMFQTAIQTGKRVRSETRIGEGSVSVATLAVDIIKQHFTNGNSFNALIVGAGKMSALTAGNFNKCFDKARVRVANRSYDHAVQFADVYNCRIADYEKRYEAVKESDVVVVSTSSEDYVIKEQILSEMLADNNNRKRLFIDLSIPRNIDPEISNIENCLVYSIDDINKLIDKKLQERASEIEKAEKIISEVAEEYFEWYVKQSIVPTMLEIKNGMGAIKEKTMSNYMDFFQTIDKEHVMMIDEMMDAYADKIIKIIMRNIRKATTKEELISITKTLRETLTYEVNGD